MVSGTGPPATAERYRRFARTEARGRSALYEALCHGVAGDHQVLAFLGRLPPPKRQPTLLLAAVRYCWGTQPDYQTFRAAVLDHSEQVAATMLARRVQTNEVGRCATLLPVLARLPQPLAILEVGTAAGLCLLLDRFGYDYGGHRLRPEGGQEPLVLPCRPIGPVPVPQVVPTVAWRAGIDIAPLDVADEADRAWLEALVWPGQAERLARLRSAMDLARADPPTVVRADLVEGLADLAADAPGHATLVVFHSAALGHLSEPEHARFAGEVARLGAVWLSNEGPTCLPGIVPPAPAEGVPAGSHFVLGQGGRRALALAHPHGDWLAWTAHPRPSPEAGPTAWRPMA